MASSNAHLQEEEDAVPHKQDAFETSVGDSINVDNSVGGNNAQNSSTITRQRRGQKPKKSHRPPNTAFRQQRLKAWHPIFIPKTIIPLLFIMAVIFAPLGAGMIYASSRSSKYEIEYTMCQDLAGSNGEFTQVPSKYVHPSFASTNSKTNSETRLDPLQVLWSKSSAAFPLPGSEGKTATRPVCTVRFNIPQDIGPSVFLYYKLTNFYQNHRRYVRSIYQPQLAGEASAAHDLKGQDRCDPLAVDSSSGKPIYPCGLIANSLFNDSFSSPSLLNSRGGQDAAVEYTMTDTGIAWASDYDRFKKTKYSPQDVVPPPNWREQYPDGYNDQNMPDLSTMENLMVWMRTAALPTFTKLARKNVKESMSAGTYQIVIQDNFPVKTYDGSKSFVIATTSIIGGKNPFLGIAYVVIGGISAVFAILFLSAHIIKPRRLADHRYLSWNTKT